MPLTIRLLRPDDLLFLTIETNNLKLDRKNPKKPMLVLDKTADPAYLIVTFPPQSITEKAYFETGNVTTQPAFNQVPPDTPPLGTTDDPLDPAGATPARMAGSSRLVFQLPKKLTGIPYELSALLDWSRLTLVVSPIAQGKPLPPPLTAPTALQTALELPYRLILSPGNNVGWVNAATPVTHDGYTELWHTRLAKVLEKTGKDGVELTFQEASREKTIPLRAIWSPDFVDHEALPSHSLDEVPFLTALSPRDRAQLVILTSGGLGYYTALAAGQTAPYTPKPVQANRLFLSTLGGWLGSRGSWPSPPSYDIPIFLRPPPPISPLPPIKPRPPVHRVEPRVTPAALKAPIIFPRETIALDLTEWAHVATQGRDQYVRVVYKGYLYPFGHAATLVKVTERKFVPAELVPAAAGFQSSVTAILRQHMYIVVREKERQYDAATYAYQGREMPFLRQVRIDTEVTPDIDKPPQNGDAGYFSDDSFWVRVDGADFQFHMTAVDLAGARIDFLAPLIFMSVSETDVGAVPPAVSDAKSVQANYVQAGAARLCNVRGKKTAFADPAAGDTILKTAGLLFDAQILPIDPAVGAPFIPVLASANVIVPSIEELLGVTTPITIQFYQPYLVNGLDGHAGVFAEVNPLPTSAVRFSADKAGGFATPSFILTALSAKKGLVAGSADDAAAGNMDPAAFFGGVTIAPKLFGTIPLPDLIPIDQITKLAPAAQNAPVIKVESKPNAHQPTEVIIKVKWEPQLTDYSLDPVKIVFNSGGQNSKLVLTATLTRPLDGSAPTSNIQGNLSNFEITLLGVVGIAMASIKFVSVNGSKANVTVKLAGSGKSAIQFIGPLHFIQTLADILPPGLFGGAGPAITLTSTGLKVSYTLGLPSISVGVFSLDDIAITAGLDLPYVDGKPGFEFAFSSRSKPFLLTVECIGGGGFVHLVLNADGIQMVEGALEFGGEFSFDIGVASGGVHIMAGIYFQLAGSKSTLTGFVDIGGNVSVLGIVSISIDVYLSLSYIHTAQGDKAQGVARLSISISILFFSISVSVQVERTFGSGSGDPKIRDLISAADWQQYANAFAG